MLNLQTDLSFKTNGKKVDQHTGGKELNHSTRHHKDTWRNKCASAA